MSREEEIRERLKNDVSRGGMAILPTPAHDDIQYLLDRTVFLEKALEQAVGCSSMGIDPTAPGLIIVANRHAVERKVVPELAQYLKEKQAGAIKGENDGQPD